MPITFLALPGVSFRLDAILAIDLDNDEVVLAGKDESVSLSEDDTAAWTAHLEGRTHAKVITTSGGDEAAVRVIVIPVAPQE